MIKYLFLFLLIPSLLFAGQGMGPGPGMPASAGGACTGGAIGVIGGSTIDAPLTAGNTPISVDTGYYSVYQPTTAGSVTYMHGTVTISTGVKFRFAVWESDGTLLGFTSEGTGDDAATNFDLLLGSEVCLATATDYLVGVVVDSADTFPTYSRSAFDAGTEIREIAVDEGTPVSFNPASSATNNGGRLIVILANNSAT